MDADEQTVQHNSTVKLDVSNEPKANVFKLDRDSNRDENEVQIFDTKTNKYSATLAKPDNNVSFDQGPQIPYRKKKLPENKK